jgi:hypothetical protein
MGDPFMTPLLGDDVERAEKLEPLLSSLREELQSETRTKLLHAEELLESQTEFGPGKKTCQPLE